MKGVFSMFENSKNNEEINNMNNENKCSECKGETVNLSKDKEDDFSNKVEMENNKEEKSYFDSSRLEETQVHPSFVNPKNEEENESTSVAVLKTQNNMLKWTCVGLAICMVVSLCLSIAAFLKPNNSNILVSDSNNNRASIVSIKGSDKQFTASEIYENNINSVVAIKTEIITRNIFNQIVQGAVAGSGFIISEDGYILTNYHVVEQANSIKVTLVDGREYDAELVGSEEENDIAVLKIKSDDTLTPVVLGDSDKMTVGEEVVAVGNPLGELTFSMTKGIVSALDREISTDLYSSINMFQVDCAVNQGNSGGPIFNMYGEVIGIVSAKYASETIEGLGFCIPINDAANIVTDLIEHGKVMNKAYMGIVTADITDTMIKQYNMVKGAYVNSVDKNSCAEKAGLKTGDIIVELGDNKIDSVSSLMSAKREYKSGDTATIKVWRSGDYIDLKIVFDEYNEEEVNKKNEEINKEYQYNYDYGNSNKDTQNDNNPYNYQYGNGNNNSSFEDFLFDYFFGNR